MKTLLLAVVLCATSGGAMARDCEEVKGEIDAKITANGVTTYTLEVIDATTEADGKVIGTCGGGAKKIVYKKN
jgi:hypothetical protein